MSNSERRNSKSTGSRSRSRSSRTASLLNLKKKRDQVRLSQSAHHPIDIGSQSVGGGFYGSSDDDTAEYDTSSDNSTPVDIDSMSLDEGHRVSQQAPVKLIPGSHRKFALLNQNDSSTTNPATRSRSSNCLATSRPRVSRSQLVKTASNPADTSSSSSSSLSSSSSSLSPPFDSKTRSGLVVKEDLVFTQIAPNSFQLKGGTLHALVLALFGVQHVSRTDYTQWFLLTYTSFASDEEIVQTLKKIYTTHQTNDGKVIRLRLCNFVKLWTESYFDDMDQAVVDEIKQFVAEIRKFDGDTCASKISDAIKLASSKRDAPLLKSFTKPAPKPLVPKKRPFRFHHIDPLEVARQLTLIEANLFSKIKPRECIPSKWTSQLSSNSASSSSAASDADRKNPILRLVKFFNHVSSMIASVVVSEKNVKKRVALIDRWIRVAVHLKELHNFHGVMEIIAGLQLSSVFRLRKTWSKLKPSRLAEYQNLRKLMNSDKAYAAYRQLLHQTPAPLVPYIGVYMQDLTFIEDGNDDFLLDETLVGDLPDGEKKKYINFNKRKMTAKLIRELQEYQQQPYNLTPVDAIANFLLGFQTLDEQQQYSRSLESEPRKSSK